MRNSVFKEQRWADDLHFVNFLRKIIGICKNFPQRKIGNEIHVFPCGSARIIEQLKESAEISVHEGQECTPKHTCNMIP